MNKELKKKLEAALEAKGLSKELVKFISITQESEIEGVVEQLSKLHKTEEPKDLDDFLKDNADAKSEFDRRVTKAIDTYKKKQGKKSDDDDDDDKPGKKKKTDDDDTPSWAKKLMSEVESLKSEKAKDSKTSTAKQLWDKSELPDTIKTKWFGRIDVDSETSIEDQIKGLESEYTELKQGLLNKESGGGGLPNPFEDGEVSDAEIEAIVN